MKIVRANIEPSLLIWARESLGFSLAEAAKKLNVSEDRLRAWEAGEARPTIIQLRRMAEVYKRPLAVFFLPEPPKGFQVMKDFRRWPGTIAGLYSPQLLLEVRRAQERRQLSLDLLAEMDEKPKPFTLKTELTDDPEVIGARIRKELGILYEHQVAWRDERVGFNSWRGAIEAVGALIFQATRVEVGEMRSFCLAEPEQPLIVVNRKDFPSARTFSLLHEFVHLMLRLSGLCDIEEVNDLPPEEQKVEIFCNRVAAATLIPRDHLLSEDLVMAHGVRPTEWAYGEIQELAKRYSVSRESLIRRLLTLNRTTEDFYRKIRAELLAEIQMLKERKKQRAEELEYRRNPPREAISDLGRSFVGLVMMNYYQERLTLSEVSEHLGVRVRHVPRVQEFMGA
jgi:Zn-dependent peptidase ImmA (M78 family)/DNA-binding XRE family transcriptional regulator